MQMEPLQSIAFLSVLVILCFSPYFLVCLWPERRRKVEEHRKTLQEAWDHYHAEALLLFPDRCKVCKEPITWDTHYQEWTHTHSQDPYCS